jgi:chemotaxis protein histidine kinase CheA
MSTEPNFNDAESSEILNEFCKESDMLLAKMCEILEELEDDNSQSKLYEKFGQLIDRIMGTAQTLGLTEIATFCELGKFIGYKSSQIQDKPLLNIVLAVLFDATDILKKMISEFSKSPGAPNAKSSEANKINRTAFLSRLKWINDKFNYLERKSIAYEKVSETGTENKLEKIMNKLKL